LNVQDNAQGSLCKTLISPTNDSNHLLTQKL